MSPRLLLRLSITWGTKPASWAMWSQYMGSGKIHSLRSPTRFQSRPPPLLVALSQTRRLSRIHLSTSRGYASKIPLSPSHGLSRPSFQRPPQQSLQHLFHLVSLTRQDQPYAHTLPPLLIRSKLHTFFYQFAFNHSCLHEFDYCTS